jgi:hypothetical protein
MDYIFKEKKYYILDDKSAGELGENLLLSTNKKIIFFDNKSEWIKECEKLNLE